MRIDVLGPLQVVVDGQIIEVGGMRLRAVLTRLALDAGHVVTFRTLASELWPDEVPSNPVPALHSLVSRLRRALPGPAVLRTEPAGYRLDLPAEAVDAIRFERLAQEGRHALRAGHRAAAQDFLAQALGLWRGEALADVAHLPFAAATAARLAELRLGAVADRIEAQAAGFDTDRASVVVELEQLIAAHPLRERLRMLLIETLDADGRQSEALAAYADYRAVLADELGTDPEPALRELHLRILRRDAAPERAHGNVPAPLTSFVGREKELDFLGDRLRGSRLVTLVGAGGVGKSRLASVAATEVAGTAWLVELGSVAESADVPDAVARALGLPASADTMAGLVDALSAAGTLLVLDGCEHVIEAAARLAEELLGRCSRLRVLATSREPLGITGEALCPVAPLEPGPAAALFIDRARAVQPGFEPTTDIDRICRRLDGLPLAIELAAARLRSMSQKMLAERLTDRFRLLTGGSRTALPHHRTLRAMVSWSWDLLTAAERRAAEQAAVFPTSFTVEAAEHVGITVEELHSLVDKSLLEAADGRYRMLDSIREHGQECLVRSGRLDTARTAHTECFLELAERAEPHLRGAGQLPWLARLTIERDNIIAALKFSCDSDDADTACRLGAVLSWFWTLRGDHVESTRRLGTVLRMPGAAHETARLHASAGYLLNAMFAGEFADASTVVGRPADTATPAAAFVQALLSLATGEFVAGSAVLEPHLSDADPWTRGMLWLARSILDGARGRGDQDERGVSAAVAGFRESGERWGLSLSLMSWASVKITAGDTTQGLAMLDEAVTATRELGTHDAQPVWLAMVRIDGGDTDGARAQLLHVLERSSSARQVSLARIPLADLARFEGDLAEAERQLGLVEDGGDLAERALYTAGTGYLAVATGDLDSAAHNLAEAAGLAAVMPDLPMLAHIAVGMADLHHRRGDPDSAAELLGAAHALRGGPNSGNPDVARLLRDLGSYRAAYERGSALDSANALTKIQSI
ncbi:BTAD domain-containing putative transcriptional regulator [Actinoalloteichus hymeniacidonis]|uniref:BTAD domain-containing putative transcriptional regulator n=1 Tax=Actinoalloteichus hymeniacidonis TaxID=340345 RepID=UPI000852A8E6|nr:BTAD domain-containing putative transcriptional regulator [Actinoalloteichus hymeniacidonis]MBB5906904.1 putative ATPase/DNA-binding SARP family transcriptional activator [Actinoalloteichus hymeniacidonis]